MCRAKTAGVLVVLLAALSFSEPLRAQSQEDFTGDKNDFYAEAYQPMSQLEWVLFRQVQAMLDERHKEPDSGTLESYPQVDGSALLSVHISQGGAVMVNMKPSTGPRTEFIYDDLYYQMLRAAELADQSQGRGAGKPERHGEAARTGRLRRLLVSNTCRQHRTDGAKVDFAWTAGRRAWQHLPTHTVMFVFEGVEVDPDEEGLPRIKPRKATVDRLRRPVAKRSRIALETICEMPRKRRRGCDRRAAADAESRPRA